MSHQTIHDASVARALAKNAQGHTITARLGAYIAGSDAATLGITACPFDPADLPELADQWHKGRQQTLEFQAGRRRSKPPMRLSRMPRRATITHAAASHPRDDG